MAHLSKPHANSLAKPLEGILVLTLEHAVAAPFVSSRLADAGARVIKIERPETGDFSRDYDHVVHGESAYFVWLNRGKESLVLDIKNQDDFAILKSILAKTDVFIQNLAPGAMERLGLGSEQLRETYPQLITCDITGYGEDGPYRNAKAYDLLIQCESGLASLTGTPDAPGRVGISVCDIATGMTAHAAIVEALHERSRTGHGRGVSVSMFDTLADWMAVPLMHYDYAARKTPRVGLSHTVVCPYGAFACSDGSLIVIAVQNQNEWQNFCKYVFNDTTIADDPRFKTNSDRLENRTVLNSMIDAVFAAKPRDVLLKILDDARIARGAVNEIEDLASHPQLDRIEIASPTGPVSFPAPPIRRSGETLVLGPSPEFDEHTEKIKKEFS